MSQDSLEQGSVRQDRVSHLIRQLGAVLSRRVGLAVGLWGEPGIGKTHAALEVLGRVPCHHLTLHATSSTVNLARALPRARSLPTWALSQLERLERGEVLAPNALAHTLTHTLAASAPFVLHFEDLHEADPERLEGIEALAKAVSKTPGVGLLVTSRTQPPEPFLVQRLEPLSQNETAVLLVPELKTNLPREALEWVYARTRGNPLFALEFARYLRRQGFLWSDGEHWHWREPPADFVPVTVEALIVQMTSSLGVDPAVRRVLEARAILPDALDSVTLEAVWAEVAGVAREGFESARGVLERAGALSAEGFTHPLFGELVRRDLAEVRRAEYALRALRALEATEPLLAVEYADSAGLESEDTAHRLEAAARRFQSAGEPIRAAHLLARAARTLEHSPQGGPQGEWGAALALEAAQLLLERDVAESYDLSRLALRHPTTRRAAGFLGAVALSLSGRADEAWALFEALSEVDRHSPEGWQTRVRLYSASWHSAEVVRLWNEHPELHASAEILTSVIRALIDLSETQRASQMIAAALERGDLDPRQRARIVDRLNAVLYREARYEEVERNLSEIIASLDEREFPRDCVAYYANRSNARTRLGRYPEAKADAEHACKLHLASGGHTEYANLVVIVSLAQIYLGEYPQAEERLLEAVSFAQHFEPDKLYDCYGHLSFLYLRWNPPLGPLLARRYAHLSLEVARTLGRDDVLVYALEDCCRAENNAGAPQAALGYAQEIERIAHKTGLEEDRIAGAFQMGKALAELGQREAATLHLRRAAELYEAHGDHAQALNALLEIDRLENDVEAARHKLTWFEAHFEQHGHYADKVRRYFPQLTPLIAAQALLPTPTSRIHVLGPVTLERGGQPVRSRARKRLEILTYLLETRIAGRTEASVLELLDALYPGESEVEARHTLSQQIYLIRSSLGAESVVSTPVGYALGGVSSDAEDFLRSGDPTLWRGAYLKHLGEGWHEGVREALTLELRTQAEALLERDPTTAARLAGVLCEMDPYEAGVLRLAVRSLEAAGETGAARRTFAEGRARLLEIGVRLPQTQGEFESGQTLA